ncbi:MAG TPA: hypothetical protein VGN57_03295 [Pirellulaceae bacterium]|jgi:hypothetical protein|nr:hypothetical protein [Pirellulaceae bacterium]
MARREVPKEDLVRDATAFAVRVEFRRTENDPDWIFVGLREGGGGSVYFGDDEFCAFNDRGELRRAFRDGRLYKAEGGRLIAMRRERTDDASVLASEELSDASQNAIVATLAERIRNLRAELAEGSIAVTRSAGHPANDSAAIQVWLSHRTEAPINVAQRPNAGG